MRIRAGLILAASLSLVVGCGGVKRFLYEGFGRDDWQQPAQVVSKLDIRDGDRVADVGAGGGYFTFRIADAVGTSGRVYAVDVDEGMLRHIARRAADEGRTNIETVKADPGDPNLPDGEIDLVFSSNTYHHLPDRPAYFAQLKRDLAPGGRIAIIDFRESGLFGSHSTPRKTIVEEMERAGLRLTYEYDFLERQSFLMFAPVVSSDSPAS